ncbi:Lipoprotein-anchoring transpeptidase ErfK/SrfK [Actinopolymorpha singaporensis]|uniref:Lipoprotein-anchoring transpeptidase ErfK/SrfK n=2 Tax=Actinopolymorpha singaporensis TaxID=117157 RepID=A0A1H1XC02_9ACTN|nr:Lipoprotein-anchoring transpeptidase ErfK/SrfK [Actinopolymorpha singaporensis]
MGNRGRMRSVVRRAGVLAALLAMVLVVGCQSKSTGDPIEANANPGNRSAATPKKTTPPAKITLSAKKSAKVALTDPVKVSVSGGKLEKVTVTSEGVADLQGTLNAARTAWTAKADALLPARTYTVTASAKNADGRATDLSQTFTTAPPAKVLGTDITPLNGYNVGVGMPIIVKFTEPVKDRAAAQKRLVLETSKPVEGAWHWFSDSEVHYRPKTYWPAHTNVTLKVNTKDFDAGNGAWGIRDKVRTFSITNSVVTKVDLDRTHTAKVYVDGKLARTIDVTGGKKGWRTRNGTKVILEKRENVLFKNEAIGEKEHYRLTGRWALRLTWSGEFLHTATWSTSSQGRANVSHGCVGMNTKDSDWLWHVSHVGDPVEVSSKDGSPMQTTGNGYGDWNVSWTDWKAGSAL